MRRIDRSASTVRGPRPWRAAAVLTAALALAAAAPALAQQAGAAYSVGIDPPTIGKASVPLLGLLKTFLLAAFAGGAFYVTNWAFIDTLFVNTNRPLWSGVVLAGVVAGLASAALVPLFLVGLPLGLILFGGAAVTYANHRNTLVTPALRVLTKAHLERVRRRLSGGRTVEDEATGPITGVGRDIIFMATDDLPIRLEAAGDAQRRANREVERVLYDAIVRRASAVGYVGRPGKGEVRFRIDGEMVPGGDVERPAADHFPAALKRLAGLDPGETRKPQEGRLRAVVSAQTFDLRIKTAGTVRGEQIAIRVIDVASSQRRLEDLGLSLDHLESLKEALAKRPALVILSSPRDSGLTTTLHACLRGFDRYVNNVFCFEAHTDIEIENVQHVVLNQEDGPVAAADVRSRIRMEPDVIGVDSLYQAEVAQVLAEALKEHTLVVGIRAVDTSQALTRVGALFGSRDPLATRLQMVVSQRLVRMLCPDCKEAYRPNPEFVRKANLGTERVDVLYRPPMRAAVNKDGHVVICSRCHNDRYVGRTGLFELMPIDDEIRQMIGCGASITDIRTHARKLGMRNLQEEGLRLVTSGHTSIEEVLRVIKQET